MGMGAEYTGVGGRGIIAAESDDETLGRIIALVPTDTVQSTFRLAEPVHDELQRLSERLGKARPEVVELAITHLSGTLRAGQPVYIDPPEPPPATHKRRRRAA